MTSLADTTPDHLLRAVLRGVEDERDASRVEANALKQELTLSRVDEVKRLGVFAVSASEAHMKARRLEAELSAAKLEAEQAKAELASEQKRAEGNAQINNDLLIQLREAKLEAEQAKAERNRLSNQYDEMVKAGSIDHLRKLTEEANAARAEASLERKLRAEHQEQVSRNVAALLAKVEHLRGLLAPARSSVEYERNARYGSEGLLDLRRPLSLLLGLIDAALSDHEDPLAATKRQLEAEIGEIRGRMRQKLLAHFGDASFVEALLDLQFRGPSKSSAAPRSEEKPT